MWSIVFLRIFAEANTARFTTLGTSSLTKRPNLSSEKTETIIKS